MRVYTMVELATMIGWERQRLVRHLLRLNAELHGLLLKNVGTAAKPRWTTTLDALKKVSPQWFQDDESFGARLEALEESQATSEARLAMAAQRIGELSGEVKHLRTVTGLLTSNLKGVLAASAA